MSKKKSSVKKKGILLDVGCGQALQPGWTGMDKKDLGQDIVHDCEDIPWPLEDESVAVIQMSHLVEHIKPWLIIDVINECWRVLEPGGLLLIVTPYATSFGYFQDPSHCCPWNEATPLYFCPEDPSGLWNIYKPLPWHIERLYWNVVGNLELAMRKVMFNE